ncbi:MAG: hypothetical protein EOP70_06885 [Variovorax sp.]|jgi:hypothetical protein|nr:MAG: hypothetical protein EOP70_06885 [Variovorax sp.]
MSLPSYGVAPSLPGVPVTPGSPTLGASSPAGPPVHATEADEFHAMVESGAGVESSGGFMRMLNGVDASRKSAESALVKVVSTGDPSRMYDATAAMARFNLQTLVLNKMASKIGQAVDRLTNLQ